MHTALGLYVVHLEPFIVKSMRKVMPQIRDEGLREEVDRFCRQESQHYQKHADFNKLVLTRDYPGLERRLQRLHDDFDGYLRNRSDRLCIGLTEGFESYTTQSAPTLLARGGARYRTTFKHRLLFTRVDPFGKRLRSMLPGYTPHRHQIAAEVAALADTLSAQAASVQ